MRVMSLYGNIIASYSRKKQHHCQGNNAKKTAKLEPIFQQTASFYQMRIKRIYV
jgi:hypothetical protein